MFSRVDADRKHARTLSEAALAWILGPGRRMASAFALKTGHQIRRNLTARRLFSFPHFLFLFWAVILLWGERWVFESKVQKCDWHDWEDWPQGASPHHLVFVADPQIIDPHSYPGRPWPLSSLTTLVTDNYVRRGYAALQRNLYPDSVFFLGDLFDGGREWKTRPGTIFVDPKWGTDRSNAERRWLKTWRRKYGSDFWVREFSRFSSIFFETFNAGGGGGAPRPYQRRKLVASLAGNHDIGFGAQVQVSVRDRFAAFFGEPNRVDIVGNHSIVSVDTVSLSADTSSFKGSHDLDPIYGPVHEFLDRVQAKKRKAAQEELALWNGSEQGPVTKLRHKVEFVSEIGSERTSNSESGAAVDLPTILLTHVPLFRPPGTPCGPRREHWPPSKSALKKDGTVDPEARDDRNAISVSAGYQYQNVLSEEDSVNLVNKVGNVVHVFSGDDHDYCEVVHSPSKGSVREITVKSFSMAMGVSTPGFLMVSLWNPVDAEGRAMPGTPAQTLQTHLCLLPNQMHTYMKYVTFIIVSLLLLSLRAFLVPVLRLTPFALGPERSSVSSASILPVHQDKAKNEPPEHGGFGSPAAAAAATSGLKSQSMALNGSGGGGGGGGGGGRGATRWSSKKRTPDSRWGRRDADEFGPRINLDHKFYDGAKSWHSAARGKRELQLLMRELWTTTWRLTWLTVVFWAYLAKER